MLITDAQIHIWEVDRPGRPWPKVDRPPQEPQLPDGYSVEQALAEMAVADVDRAVLIPPTYVGEGNETALEAHAAHPDRFAIMGRFDIQRSDLVEALATWRQQPGMLGIRHTLFGKFRDWFEAGAYDPFWAAAERYGVPVMCLANGAPEIFEPIATRHPELTLIIDHFGAYLEREGPPAFAMLDRLLPLARHPNVYVKVTGAPSLSTEPYPFSDLEPFIRAVYEAFGARRLMWGADITRLRGTYSDCVRHFQEGLDFLSDDDRAWILGKTVATALGWPEPDGVSGIP